MKANRGIIYMIVAGLFFFLMSLSVKWLDRIPTSQIVFFRAWVALAISLVAIRRARIPILGNNRKILFLRGLFGTIALALFFSTLHHMPIATAVILQYLSPIFTTILAALFLSEKVRPIQWLFFLFAFLGIILVKGIDDSQISNLWLFAGILGALGSAGAYTCIGKIGSSEHPLTIVLYLPMITVPVVALPTYFQWVPPNPKEWLVLIAVGIFVQIAQYFMTLSYQSASASRVSIISYLGAIYAGLAGYFLFEEKLSIIAILGAAILLSAVLANTVISSKK